MGEYFVWYLITIAINLIIAGITLFYERERGQDITLKVVSIVALIVFVPYLNSVLLFIGLVMFIIYFGNEAFDWLGEKFDTVVLFKRKRK